MQSVDKFRSGGEYLLSSLLGACAYLDITLEQEGSMCLLKNMHLISMCSY